MSAPQYDADGLNVLDPRDTLGFKSRYITLLQELALAEHLQDGAGRVAVDLGCGYGRLSGALHGLGWRVIGIDPAEHLLSHARTHVPGVDFRQGALPTLPLGEGEVDLLLMQNLLRVLWRMDRLEWVRGIGRHLGAGGAVVVVDNIWPGRAGFLPEETLLALMREEGFELRGRHVLRAGRWWLLWLIRYGLVPEDWLGAIAARELALRARERAAPWFSYRNVLFRFERAG